MMDQARIDQINRIREDMPLVGPDGRPFATVDHVDAGHTIKLKEDEQGRNHWIPFDWITWVDDEVRIARPGDQAMREWRVEPSQGA